MELGGDVALGWYGGQRTRPRDERPWYWRWCGGVLAGRDDGVVGGQEGREHWGGVVGEGMGRDGRSTGGVRDQQGGVVVGHWGDLVGGKEGWSTGGVVREQQGQVGLSIGVVVRGQGGTGWCGGRDQQGGVGVGDGALVVWWEGVAHSPHEDDEQHDEQDEHHGAAHGSDDPQQVRPVLRDALDLGTPGHVRRQLLRVRRVRVFLRGRDIHRC